MGKIYYVMGKSSSGKDTVYKKLMERHPGFRTIVPYTTRPIRRGSATAWSISLWMMSGCARCRRLSR